MCFLDNGYLSLDLKSSEDYQKKETEFLVLGTEKLHIHNESEAKLQVMTRTRISMLKAGFADL